jgi:hypothetical protein
MSDALTVNERRFKRRLALAASGRSRLAREQLFPSYLELLYLLRRSGLVLSSLALSGGRPPLDRQFPWLMGFVATV